MINLENVTLKNYIKNDMTRESDGEASIFGQSGYDFVSAHFDFYIHPAEYVEIVNSINFLSS